MVMLESRRAACSCACRSRAIERAITAPLDIAKPCAKRAAATAATDAIKLPMREETSMVASPASSTGLRPKRSDSGPHSSMPAASPMK